MKYADGICNYTLYLFDEAVKEYFKDGGEAENLVNNWKEQNKQLKYSEFAQITKEEVDTTKNLLDFKKSHNNEIGLPFPVFLPIFTKCPHMATEILTILNGKCGYYINLETLELIKKD